MSSRLSNRWCVAVTVLGLGLAGCATTTGPAAEDAGAYDPLEGINRPIYKFNDAIDRGLLRPAAKTYERIVPDPIRSAVNNFFNNAFEPTVIVNDVLQGKGKQAASDTGRFVVNTTVGLLGLFDVATGMGLERHNEDFGQTLAKWGFGAGPYLVVPFLGPTNVRDGIGLAAYYGYFYPFTYIEDDTTRLTFLALDVLNWRTNFLGATDMLDQAALDPYIFTREAYLQKRRDLIYDGNPPLEFFQID
jgi:phospholipid-binding lipoprotein MlaA